MRDPLVLLDLQAQLVNVAHLDLLVLPDQLVFPDQKDLQVQLAKKEAQANLDLLAPLVVMDYRDQLGYLAPLEMPDQEVNTVTRENLVPLELVV